MNIDKLLNEYGQWWLPSNLQRQVHGTIKKVNNHYILEIVGNLCTDNTYSNQTCRFDIINGIVNHQKITIVSCILNMVSDKYSFIFEHGFMGYHFNNVTDLKFIAINFSCGKILNNWLNLTYPKKQISHTKFSLEYEPPETVLIRLIKSKLIVKIIYAYNCHTTTNEINFKSKPFISLEHLTVGNSLPCSELLNNVDWFTKFLHICCWQPIEPNEISFNIDENNVQSIGYFSGLIKQPTESMSPFTIMPYKAIEKNIDGILDNWYENRNRYHVTGYIMAKLTDPDYSVPLELKFTQAIQAVEVFHRRFFLLDKLKNSRTDVLKDYIDFFVALFKSAAVDKDLKTLVKSKLNSLSEITLHDRVDDLKKSLPQEIINDTIINDEEYAKQIVKIRNLYTHWDGNDYPTLQEIRDYTESLRLLLVIAIFKQLKIDDTTIISCIRPDILFQRTLNNRPM